MTIDRNHLLLVAPGRDWAWPSPDVSRSGATESRWSLAAPTG